MSNALVRRVAARLGLVAASKSARRSVTRGLARDQRDMYASLESLDELRAKVSDSLRGDPDYDEQRHDLNSLFDEVLHSGGDASTILALLEDLHAMELPTGQLYRKWFSGLDKVMRLAQLVEDAEEEEGLDDEDVY